MANTNTRMDWWKKDKLGMFMHFGLYSILAGKYEGTQTENIAEWIMHDLQIPVSVYEKLANTFNPTEFNADSIVKLAKDSGMHYITFTSKHHDGFALYHSQCSKYNSVDASPCKRDFVKELQESCKKHDIKLCLYYSQAQDWHDKNGYEDGTDNSHKNFETYFYEKCLPQVRELLTNYGDIGMMWFDTPMSMTYEQSKELHDLVRSLQPNCIINGRIGNDLGDYMATGDNFIPLLPYHRPFEVPATTNSSWGCNKFDKNWKDPDTLIRHIVKIVSRGGNYLLNIGPWADGSIPPQASAIFNKIGNFLNHCGESIYNTIPLPVYPYDIDWGQFTFRPKKLYIHVFKPMDSVYLLNIRNKPLKAYLLTDKTLLTVKERKTCEGDSSWLIKLPPPNPDCSVDTVICVEIAEDMVEFEPITG